MADYFLFHGGHYKYDIDDGRRRVPLDCREAHALQHDPEVPGDTDNSVGGMFNLNEFRDIAKAAVVDDYLYTNVIPDATIIRGLWVMAQTAYEGFTFDVELVDVCEVYEAIEGGGTGADVAPVGETISYDAVNGLGYSIEDAVSHASVEDREDCDLWKDYRNEDALELKPFAMTNWIAAGIGNSHYIRLKITALPDPKPDGECKDCGKDDWPQIQVGAIIDKTCVLKNLIRNTCECSGGTLTAHDNPCE